MAGALNWSGRRLLVITAAALLTVASSIPAQASSPAPDPRSALVEEIRSRAGEEYPGLTDSAAFKAALAAIARIDRKSFVPRSEKDSAYDDTPLPIGFDQTISQPYVVAIMTSALEVGSGSNVLEVGTGSGYQAAVLSELGATVHTIEIVPELAEAAEKRLRHLGFKRVSVKAGDGFAGWPQFAPYDAIVVTAGSTGVPAPLVDQLRQGGKLVMPIGANTYVRQLVVYTKGPGGGLSGCSLGPEIFVPLTGQGEAADVPGLYDRSIPLCHKGQTARWPGQEIP